MPLRPLGHLSGLVGSEERVGVEPTLPFGKPDFESGAFGHSAISPLGRESYAADAAERQAPLVLAARSDTTAALTKGVIGGLQKRVPGTRAAETVPGTLSKIGC